MNPTNNFFGIKVSKNGIPVNQASDKQLVYKDDFSTKTYFDTLDARMVEGLLPDGTYGLWVSKPGFDVSDPNAANDGTLVFNSNQDILKIVNTFTVTVPAVTATSGSSAFTSSQDIDLTPYPSNVVILPIALSANFPSFVWQGFDGTPTISAGSVSFSILLAYETAYDASTGLYKLTRVLNNGTFTTQSDTDYTVKVFILDETIS